MISLLLRILGVFLLIGANAFFVAAEFALVSVRDTRVQQLVDARRVGARTVQRLHRNFEQLLLAVQFGVTLSSLALGWVGEPTLARMIGVSLAGLPRAEVYSHVAAVALAFTLITYMHVILGEVVPKSLALQRVERVALAVAPPMEVFITLARPFLFLMRQGSGLVLSLFGLKTAREGGVHSPEELKLIVTSSRRVGLLPSDQEEMIHRALELGNVTVREVMVPRPDIFSLPADMSLDAAAGRVVDDQHSRIPIYDPQRGPEHIIGVLYSKDLARLMYMRFVNLRRSASPAVSQSAVQVRHIMRDVLVVPETKPLTDLLSDFKERRRHLAVVVDEHGSTVGMVTVEDVLEQVVGAMEDEFDVDEPPPLPLAPVMVLDGAETIRDLELQYRFSFPRDHGFETLAGFALWRFQRVPKVGNSFEYDGRLFTVLEMDGHRIAQMRVETLKPEAVESVESKE